MKKKIYMKPAMRVVRIRHQHIICTSTGDYDKRSLQMHSGSGNQIEEEEDVW